MKTKNLENFQKLVSNEQSSWLDKFLYYKANKSWLDKSAMVAVNVLEALKANGWSQKDLAQKMKVSAQQVNKILKGQQNLTFETISKLESALDISLMEIIDYKPVTDIKTSATQIKSVPTTLIKEIILRTDKEESPLTIRTQMRVVHKRIPYSRPRNKFAIAR
ncbi:MULTISPECIES: helix-turn-helix transcriptional regulator [unclassified Flavobacterium]|uniref:helix-turn-helix domain-containing protein n=1 Tax=unclassified Flavobacterium TaxID=196869 RepID=UPI00131AA1DE|nr:MULTISPECIES: helix-turn-helix transcriptional regulator [unclassified Flavobacterium]